MLIGSHARDQTSKDHAELSLNITNYNIQILKEQLAMLNSVEMVGKTEEVIPMISLRLKETKELDLMETLKDLIENHYHEDREEFEDSIAELMDIRQSMRSPLRDSSGIRLLFTYFNHLDFVEKRFIDSEDPCQIKFEW